ncbi:MAG: hypothetical protein WC650_00295 [Candidatus Doudnabacteria bacterium]
MGVISRLKNGIVNFKKNQPQIYYLAWLFLTFLVLFLLNASLYAFLFWGTLLTFLILNISDKIPLICGLILLVFTAIFSILKDEYLANIAAAYALLFLFVTIFTQLKIFLSKKKRLPINIFKKIDDKRSITIFILIFLILIPFHKVLVTKGYIEAGDLNFPINNQTVLGNVWFLWNDYGSFNRPLAPNIFPISLFNTIFTQLLNLPSDLTIKLILLEILLCGAFSSYFLMQTIFQAVIREKQHINLASLLATAFYLFNPYALNRIFHFYHFIGYTLTPLVLLVFLKFKRQKKILLLLILALLFNFISFSPHYLVYNFIMLGIFILIESAIWVQKSFLKQNCKLIFKMLARNLGYLLIFVLFFLTLGAYWLYPYLQISLSENKPNAPDYMLTSDYFEKPQEPLKTLFFTLSLNGEETNSLIINFIFRKLIFILPLLLFLPLFPSFRNKYTVFFSLLGVFATILSTMPIWHYTLYQKILFDIPYFKNFGWLFRESSRINGLLAFSYSFLLAFLFSRVAFKDEFRQKIDLFLSKKAQKKKLKIEKLNSKIRKMKKKLQKVKNNTYV